ncbi:hypothetical protein QBC32DRAFT_45527 [Pseudoneurospora amorphoporcata]|uniref:Zn(2)-C6 fungal-type domain-containing protein n=1 Tax=Pseudoneurospora amorphoporcata TaxID=241081 RepID=A0AAN6SDH0_9PEZI|nr:hypothetical protein QBC32DRAFT_45527 [Pseudoneurospora amorphoporcata]
MSAQPLGRVEARRRGDHGPRLGYKKSRNGCLRCKARRVKCDENKPCSACQRHGVLCSLVTAGTIPVTDTGGTSRPAAAPFTTGSGPGLVSGSGRTMLPTSRTAPVSHDEISFNTAPTPRHTPMAIQALTHPPYVDVSGPSTPSPAWQLPLPINFSQARSHDHCPTPQSRSRHPSPLRQSPMSTEAFNTPATDPFSYLDSFIPPALANPASSSDSDLAWQGFVSQDFHLFSHYTTTTYTTLTGGAHGRIWKIEVPKLAYSHPFLMHSLLATAAYHLAYTEQDQENKKHRVNDGRHHFSLALQGMGQVLRKDGVTPENCHVVFPASTLLFIGAMCGNGPCFNPANHDREQGKTKAPMIDELLNIFRTVKGIGTIVNTQQDHLHQGPMGGLFNPDSSGDRFPSMERLLAQLEGFYHRVATIPCRSPGLFPLNNQYGPENYSTLSSSKANQIVLGEIKAMEDAIKRALNKSRTPEQEIVAVWPINASAEFVELLEDPGERPRSRHVPLPSISAFSSPIAPPPGHRNPVALALLGYYCCLMKESERTCWFTKDWAEAVIKEVVAELEDMAGVAPTSTTINSTSGGNGKGQTHTGVERPSWMEWVRREWLGDAMWAREWVMAKGEEELPEKTTKIPGYPCGRSPCDG